MKNKKDWIWSLFGRIFIKKFEYSFHLILSYAIAPLVIHWKMNGIKLIGMFAIERTRLNCALLQVDGRLQPQSLFSHYYSAWNTCWICNKFWSNSSIYAKQIHGCILQMVWQNFARTFNRRSKFPTKPHVETIQNEVAIWMHSLH